MDQLLLDRSGLLGQEGVFVRRAAHPDVLVQIEVDQSGDDLLRRFRTRSLVSDQNHIGFADVLRIELLPQGEHGSFPRGQRRITGQIAGPAEEGRTARLGRGGFARRVENRLRTDGIDDLFQQRVALEQVDDRVQFVFAIDLDAVDFVSETGGRVQAQVLAAESHIEFGFGTVGLGPDRAEDECADHHGTAEGDQLPAIPRNDG